MTEEMNKPNTEQAQEQNVDSTETGDPASKGKTFTQDEVNRIVSDRLARERSKAEAPASDREQELNVREQNLKCRELIADNSDKYPQALLKVLDTSDFEKFKTTADALIQHFPNLTQPLRNPPPPALGSPVREDPIAEVFKPKN